MGKIRILVADSHEVMRLGISVILKCANDFEIVGEAATCGEIITAVDEYNPDVVIMDSRFNGECSVEVCGVIQDKYQNVKVVMLVSPSDEDIIFGAIMAGANGLLPRQLKSDELIRAVRMVHDGKSMLDPSITSKVMNKVKTGFTNSDRKESLLNSQERRILALIAEGKTNKEIANLLMLSNNTIKNYVSAILSKLNFSNRAEAAAYAVRNNLIRPSKRAGEGP